MNMKKIAVLPLAVVAMGLTSCNNGLSRHSFKDSTKENIINFFNSLSGKQVKDGKTTMQSDKVTLDANTNYSGTLFRDGNNLKINDKVEYKVNLDKKNKTAKFTINQEGYNLFEGFDDLMYTKQSLNNYIKFTDTAKMNLYCDNNTGAKTKETFTAETNDFNTYIVNTMPKTVMLYGDIFVLLFATNVSMNFDVDLTGANLYSTYIQSGVADRFNNAKATVKYGSNDENSAMISIKGSLGFEDYFKCWSGLEKDATKTFSGTVDFDYFGCLEDCFVTQTEVKVKFNDCKMLVDNKQTFGINASAYSKSNINYKSGSDVTVDETQFVELD